MLQVPIQIELFCFRKNKCQPSEFENLENVEKGDAIFFQPKGIIKCKLKMHNTY